MNNVAAEITDTSPPPPVNLSDLEQLWGDLSQCPFADEETRAHYLANDCPLLLLIDDQKYQQPLCA